MRAACVRKQTAGGGGHLGTALPIGNKCLKNERLEERNDYLPPCARTWTRQSQETALRNLVALTSSLQSKPSPKDRTEVERRDRTGGDM